PAYAICRHTLAVSLKYDRSLLASVIQHSFVQELPSLGAVESADASRREHSGVGEPHVDAHPVVSWIDCAPMCGAAASLAAMEDDGLVAPLVSVGGRRRCLEAHLAW